MTVVRCPGELGGGGGQRGEADPVGAGPRRLLLHGLPGNTADLLFSALLVCYRRSSGLDEENTTAAPVVVRSVPSAQNTR